MMMVSYRWLESTLPSELVCSFPPRPLARLYFPTPRPLFHFNFGVRSRPPSPRPLASTGVKNTQALFEIEDPKPGNELLYHRSRRQGQRETGMSWRSITPGARIGDTRGVAAPLRAERRAWSSLRGSGDEGTPGGIPESGRKSRPRGDGNQGDGAPWRSE